MRRLRRQARHAPLAALALWSALAVPGTGMAQSGGDRLPDEDWMRYSDVRDAGFDPEKLEDARETWESLPSAAFMIIADGAVVAAWGDVDRRYMCHSVRKSFLSALYGIYWDRGEIDLNKTLADLGIDDDPDPLLETEKRARILDLLKARSGVFHPAAYAGRTDSRPRGSEGPGRYFAYNNWDFNTSATILMQETGEDVFEAFDQYFGQPLGMEDWRVSDGYYHYERDKSKYPAYPFRMSARDAARFGLLFARDGLWGDQRILSEHWVRRSSALYSIDNDVMGYGFYWWIFREARFTKHGMYAANGVGNQLIAVLPKSDMVIVNRADTYVGESTPMPALLDLIEEVLEARAGEPAAEPALTPLQVTEDPSLAGAPAKRLEEFVGSWAYPPSPLGLPASTTVELTLDGDHLVSYSPVSGTFKLYLQPDGALHEEDSMRRYYPVRAEDGSLAGIANVNLVVSAAVRAATEDQGDRAEALIGMVEGDPSTLVGVGAAVVDLLGGQTATAERTLKELAERGDPARIEVELMEIGVNMFRSEMPEHAREIFQLGIGVFPESFRLWHGLGASHLELSDNDEAIRALERSLELNSDNPDARRMLAQARGG